MKTTAIPLVLPAYISQIFSLPAIVPAVPIVE